MTYLSGINPVYGINNTVISPTHSSVASIPFASKKIDIKPKLNFFYKPVNFNTKLNSEERDKYNYLLNFLKGVKPTLTSDGLTPRKQLDILLHDGRLLAKNANDNSSILDNLYEIATTDRAEDLDKKNLISNTLDIIINPAVVTQNFGDIPSKDKAEILSKLPDSSDVKNNPGLMDVTASGTCVAASNEVNLADKYPSEFARWVNKLSSKDRMVTSKIKLSSISKNKLEAIEILNLMKVKTKNFNFDSFVVEIRPDDNAYIRAKNQDKNWDLGERSVADVLVQSAIMQLGSQETYDSLSDIRSGEFNSNPQGLIEFEKTLVESILKNKEIESRVYQVIDDNTRLVGYNYSFEKTRQEIINILDSGDDVILGYIEVSKEDNSVLGGHEITVVGYSIDKDNNTIFSCIDTDDGKKQKIEIPANELIPKINHAGIPVQSKKNIA